MFSLLLSFQVIVKAVISVSAKVVSGTTIFVFAFFVVFLFLFLFCCCCCLLFFISRQAVR